MNCDQVADITGLGCEELVADGGEALLSVEMPYRFLSGNPISVFVEKHDKQFRFFDAGETLFELLNTGFKLNDRRRWRPLKTVLEPFSVSLRDDGEIECWSTHDNVQSAFARFTSSLIALTGWQRENAGIPEENQLLIEEVEFYLTMWKPTVLMERDIELVGLSGRTHTFAFKLDSELIDVVSGSPVATGAELRKLVDVRGKPSFLDLPIKVIVDDRKDKARAKQEAMILGRFASTWPMSELMKSAGRFTNLAQ